MDKYTTYDELKQSETEDEDYTILYRDLSSDIAIIAPHGGGIEPGTIDIADELAGCEYTFYGFKGLKKAGNAALHINSNNFDEPIAFKAVHGADIVISVHGTQDKSEMVCVGGPDSELKRTIIKRLNVAGFNAEVCRKPGLEGISPENICNRCRTKKGVQLELSRGLRETLFENLSQRSLRKKTVRFYQFVNTLREALTLFETNGHTAPGFH